MKILAKIRFISKDTTNGGFTYYPKDYWYILTSNKEIKVKKNDYIVMEAGAIGNSQCLSVVKVFETKPFCSAEVEALEMAIGKSLVTKEVLGKADLKDFFAEKERQEKIKQINANLVNRFKQAEKLALYKQLAETDPVMKELLSELEALGGSVDTEYLDSQADLY